ncbi:protein adenylyltransferase SelO family protein [Klebsiella pneumoniae]|nr:protein adenylyltransferase SelO family protein [Klebsiella pneumoniae]
MNTKVQQLADYVRHHWPGAAGMRRISTCYGSVTTCHAYRCRLSASWQTVGFAHGVMNTDNMSILGLTMLAVWLP